MRRALRQASGLLLGLLLLTLVVLLGRADALDGRLGPALQAPGSAWATVTQLGGTTVVLAAGAAAAAMLWWLRGRIEGVLMAALTGAQWVVIWSMKHLVGRDRPEGILEPASPAFPSGHALGATAVYLGAAVLAAKWQDGRTRQAAAVALAAAIALAVGWSRLALGVHHPTDVLGGWMAGAALVILAHDLRSSIPAAQDAGRRRAGPPRSPPPPGAP